MDVPLVLNNIGVRNGLKGNQRKPTTLCLMAYVDGLSAFLTVSNDRRGQSVS